MVVQQHVIQRLKQNGYKLTEKREKLLELFSNESKSLSAKDVQTELKKAYPNISQDTIYRNLHTFVELNLLEETELKGEKLFRYKCDTSHHHHHFICTNCGETKALEICPLDFFEGQLPGCTITDHRFELFGICDKCQSKK
ncbi:Fur family transcriptional regulator [Lacticigenium naphthae]|uniref:Fur family transcriptional regulator n=1 Tax=Lacticigenium naphthae TaxID=515351 RepID=UPI00041E88B0|nr:Fur family transcriptional regulator [Lacticigenium naphthae]